MSNYGSIGSTCRLYVDYVQYAKAIGYIDSYAGRNIYESTESAWSYSPSRMMTYTTATGGVGYINQIAFDVNFKNGIDGNLQFGRLLSSINYYGALGTDLGTFAIDSPAVGVPNFQIELFEGGSEGGNNVPTAANHSHGTAIVGTSDAETSMGYIIKDCGTDFLGNDSNWDTLSIGLQVPDDSPPGDQIPEAEPIDVGTFIAGRYFDFPRSADLNVTFSRNYEGISTKNTVGGYSISNINYFKPPDWGDLAPWTHYDNSIVADGVDPMTLLNFKPVSQNGRRSWSLKWSYLDKKQVFPKTSEGTMIGIFDYTAPTFDSFDASSVHEQNIFGSLMSFSLGGQIPMMFQPDTDNSGDFAMVKINQKSISVKQVAFGTYDISLKLTEVW